ncbi:hypothetical protein [Bifidobacterium samirii]|uniref:Uncharacterized protein n=1 Tax=Bifidobacterium samirii TaxID=2306974 RepID=A0A430FU00_9BIFI|nr:hypothetical protein [Bifidobacterium samirii]RSX56544.1 hypothetical protein D2E24_1089 [Bifidobacterium samirii]
MKKWDMDCRREVAFTRDAVADLYRENVLGGADVRVTFATCLAYALEVYEAEVSKNGPVDFDFYRKAPASMFGATDETIDCPDIRYRVQFNASPALIERLDKVKDDMQEALSGSGKINRNWVVAIIFRVAIDVARGSVHHL